ncbi:MAG: hypothetical protein ABR548_11045 [Actinomycetota bacterium]|nr:hypothetical protein [Actinomycetota bacterium]
MDGNRTHIRRAGFGAALIALTLVTTSAGAATVEAVDGLAFRVLQCAPTSAAYTFPSTVTGHCEGTATWQGSWTGEAIYDALGKVDLVTGDATGTVSLDFNGIAMRNTNPNDRHSGQLHMTGTFKIIGATGEETATLTIISGTENFAGAKGTAVFDAFNVYTSGGPATGSFSGSWTHPAFA